MPTEETNKRVPIIAGNWKMNMDVAGSLQLVRDLREKLEAVPGVEQVLCPPFTSLAAVEAELAGSSIKVGAQNVFWEDKGAYTGEISPLMLKPLCEYVIVGHSERRQYFGETDATVNKRVQAALKHGLKVIMCVGENLEENRAGRTEEIIGSQVRGGLENVPDLSQLVIAYEPVWAIGTGLPATGAGAAAVVAFIRRVLAERFGESAAQATRVQYGGSVNAGNIAEFMGEVEIDGALVGGASLKAADFAAIVTRTAEVKGSRGS
jgi:triosephosphate isomerase (TIM)